MIYKAFNLVGVVVDTQQVDPLWGQRKWILELA